MGSASMVPSSVGRHVRRSEAQWRSLMTEFETSGISQHAFCARHGLAKSTFELWRRKLREARTADAIDIRPEALFVELSAPVTDRAEAPPAAPAWEVELDLGAGVVLRLRRGVPC